MNVRRGKPGDHKGAYVYRYIDLADGIVKYVGIVHKTELWRRLAQHAYVDDWCKNGRWNIQYFECRNRSEAEAFESHLIALYGTGRYFNKVKSTWGINGFLPNVETWWKTASIQPFADLETYRMSLIFRRLLRDKKFDEAHWLYQFFEFENAL